MRYFLRALKYFFKIVIIFAAIILVLKFILPQYKGESIPGMFKDGMNSIYMIIGIFAVFSGIYPLLTYGKKVVPVPTGNVKERINNAMIQRDYTLLREDETTLVYTQSKIGRMLNNDFDAVTITLGDENIEIEGFRKEITRIYF